MRKTLKSLWNSNAETLSTGPNDPEIDSLFQLIHSNREKICARLNEEEKRVLDHYDDCFATISSLREEEIFIQAFRLGMQLAVAGLCED
ncbi:MAG: hypothetical protein IJX39_04000 [Clostridia bacterium]|nr:hypothetical protein [Clostridia bacterium]